jgi:hypothetical protein
MRLVPYPQEYTPSYVPLIHSNWITTLKLARSPWVLAATTRNKFDYYARLENLAAGHVDGFPDDVGMSGLVAGAESEGEGPSGQQQSRRQESSIEFLSPSD